MVKGVKSSVGGPDTTWVPSQGPVLMLGKVMGMRYNAFQMMVIITKINLQQSSTCLSRPRVKAERGKYKVLYV